MTEASGSVLRLDDDETFLYTTTKILERAGFTVSPAPDVNVALEVLDSGVPIDLMVTDIYFPSRVHGFALARMARMRRLDLKVLYVTGFDAPEAEAAAQASL
jgi:CheY-like chemotaxis protein